ncbi:MAG: PHP domain-containing protein [Clostridia bacterium]|nr:PHP domain-containing protein [Clostridia bacterium]
MPIDLHCHTRLSDGSLGIEDLIILAANSDVKTLAITDHDCIAGNVRARIIGERHGVKIIHGVEFSAYDDEHDKKVHILCYLAEKPDRLEGLCKKNSLARRKAGQIMVIKTCRNFPINPEFITKCASGSTNIYKQHIMHALMECGYTNSIFGELFQKLFVKEGPENINSTPKYPSPFEIVRQIHEAGGIAVLAHPGFYDNFDILDELIENGLDGVEVWHPENSEEEIEKLIKIADENDLLKTGGSDFHGMYNSKPVKLGCCGVSEKELQALLDYKAKKKKKNKK